MSNLSNLCIFIGNVGDDPDMHYTQTGTAVVNLSLATDAFKRKADGTYEKITQWVRLTFFSESAERVNEYVRKGYKLAVQAHYRSRPYEDQTGETRYSNEFIVDGWTITGYPRNSEGGIRSDDREQAPLNIDENDIPF